MPIDNCDGNSQETKVYNCFDNACPNTCCQPIPPSCDCINFPCDISPSYKTAKYFCVQQMQNIIRQIIEFYPNNQIIIYMESGLPISGRPGFIIPPPLSNPDGGLFQILGPQGVLQEAVAICHIVAINIPGVIYNNSITYLQAPTPLPKGYDADIENAIRINLPIGTYVTVYVSIFWSFAGTVSKNKYGAIVLVDDGVTDITFVSSCMPQIIRT